MAFAEVVVNSPASRGASTYYYEVPPDMVVSSGHLVLVPFGAQTIQGIVLSLPSTVPMGGLRLIEGVVDPAPVLSPMQMELAHWISEYYRSSLVDAVGLMIPAGAAQQSLIFVGLNPAKNIPDELTTRQQQVVTILQEKTQIRLDRIARYGPGLRRAAGELLRSGTLVRRFELERAKARAKSERWLAITDEGRNIRADNQALRRSPSQVALLEILRQANQGVAPLAALLKQSGATTPAATALVSKGLATFEHREVWRDPLASQLLSQEPPPVLTREQQAAWEQIEMAIASPEERTFLLHGVTGSGKTELYLRAVEKVLGQGQGAIVLVPEIALTPQTVHRFASRFPGHIAIQHSQLSQGERYDQWRRLRDGLANVVVGPRSALFAPVVNLGLIILDEEHEWTYKQDNSPRYHARETAAKMAELTRATIILGSATPDVVSYYRAQQGRFTLLRLTDRVQAGALPPVHVVDMRRELREGNRSIFSRALAGALAENLAAGEQSILFLNRRGTATFVLCRDCGHVVMCGRCDSPLVYHTSLEGGRETMLCHICNRGASVPEMCPSCHSARIRYFGAGTEKIESEVRKEYPLARVVRWDRDAAKGKFAYEKILAAFARHEADILVGTQMIAKGLDLPMVTVVGVVAADTSLHLPDFRSAERTFQLLAQVAGRAGRRDLPGRVIVQTYSPEHYAAEAASLHDYNYFYQRELEFRRQHDYPPFGSLAKLLYAGSGDLKAQAEAERFGRVLHRQVEALGLPGTDILGPAPSFWHKVRGRYRWQIIIRGQRVHELLESIETPPHWTVDVDPVSVL